MLERKFGPNFCRLFSRPSTAACSEPQLGVLLPATDAVLEEAILRYARENLALVKVNQVESGDIIVSRYS